uniref:RNA helicase n=1 Tax=Steinernema glaseri TaxID=37863 RepID=A0A1I7ZKL3_9BILA
MSWRSYQNRFVPASSASSSSSTNGTFGNVPPPPQLTMPNAAAQLVKTVAERRQLSRQKEAEYNSLVYSGVDRFPGSSTSYDDVPEEPKRLNERKRRIEDDDYLENDSDNEPGVDGTRETNSNVNDCDEDDPLDAFMAEINEQAKKDKSESENKEKKNLDAVKGGKEVDCDGGQKGRDDIDREDMHESYFKFLEEQKERAVEEDEIHEYDEDGNIIWTWKKVIDPLPPIDHSQVQYKPFRKNVYHEHEQIRDLTCKEAESLRESIGIRVYGMQPPKPVSSFAHFGFDEHLLNAVIKSEYEKPTPIQAQGIPAALLGRDVLGIAKTGSGKTAAYIWPAIVHIMEQPELESGDGPIALVVVPTRELAVQVYQEAKKFCKVYNINVVCAYGGGNKYEQQRALEEGAELVVCTPGRIIDLVKIQATNFTRVTFLVFDEADRMFDMGFEQQVKSISEHVRPDRQCLMFSATFKSKVERLARDALNDPVRIIQGSVGEANADVLQSAEVLGTREDKWVWLTQRLVEFTSLGKVLIFVTKKIHAEELAHNLKLKRNVELVLLHGDMHQHERNEKLKAFRGDVPVMVATDVAARGLDIAEIRTVINYDVAKDIDTHVHRIGRTGRAGNKGQAFTLLLDEDKEFAGDLVRNLESVNQLVPPVLLDIAMKVPSFAATRNSHVQRYQPQSALMATVPVRTGSYKPKLRPGFGSAPARQTTDSVFDALASFQTTPKNLPGGAISVEASTSSTGMTRAQMMRAAYKSSFKQSFKPASVAEDNRLEASDPRPEWKIKLEQRAAEIARSVGAPNSQTTKKTRWN